MDLRFVQSRVDPCVFYQGSVILLCYVNDTIICGPNAGNLDQAFREIGTKFNITNEGPILDYLGVKVEKLDNRNYSLTQPHLIQSILDILGFCDNTKPKGLPALSSKILHKDTGGEPFNEKWSYCSVVGKLNFLEKSTRPEIAYAVHQCARFSSSPKASCAIAII